MSTKGSSMRRFLLLATAGVLAALVATSPAAAKGPSTASLTGPGLDHALPVKGEGEAGTGTPLGALVQLGGVFPPGFLQGPGPPTPERPPGQPRAPFSHRDSGPRAERDGQKNRAGGLSLPEN